MAKIIRREWTRETSSRNRGGVEKVVGRSAAGVAVGMAEENTELLILFCRLRRKVVSHRRKPIHGSQSDSWDIKKRVSHRGIIGVPKYLRSICRCCGNGENCHGRWPNLSEADHVCEHNKTFLKVNQ